MIKENKNDEQDNIYHNQDELEQDQNVSKSVLNLGLMKDFPYEIEVRETEIARKSRTFYICKFEDCNKEFTRTWNMLDHARAHIGVKPFECEVWGKKFTQKGNLRKHAKIHNIPDVENRKRYKCEICSSSYTERYNYKVLHIDLLISYLIIYIYLCRFI